MPGWTYFFHGFGCCLSREGGEVLDVDFVDGGTEWIDPYFYQSYLESVAGGPRAERGLICDEPYDSAWTTDIESLRALGWVEGDHKIRLTPLGRELGNVLGAGSMDTYESPLVEAWDACLVGRFDVAAELMPSGDVPTTLIVAQDALLRARVLALEGRVDGTDARYALKALAALGRERAEATVARQLQREPLDGVVSAALDVLARWDVSDHREAIAETMMRARGEEVPAPHIRAHCAEMLMLSSAPDLLDRRERKKLLKALKQPGRASDGECGLLLYLLDERLGLRRLRSVLASDIPIARTEAACALGIVGTPNAIEILRGVESPEAQSILALLRGQAPVNGPEPIGRPVQWEGQVKRVYGIDEVMSAQVGDFTAESFAEMQERYGPLLRRWLAS